MNAPHHVPERDQVTGRDDTHAAPPQETHDVPTERLPLFADAMTWFADDETDTKGA